MDHYNLVFLQQLVPYLQICLSEGSNDAVSHLRSNFEKHNISNTLWDNSIIKARLSSARFLITAKDSLETPKTLSPKRSDIGEVHSILSPFNPESDIYPNGIISEGWFEKYTQRVPFAFVATFSLPPASGDQEFPELDPLVQKITLLRQQFQAQNIRFVVIIISSGNEELRIQHLRSQTELPRLTGLLYLEDGDHLERDSAVLVSTLLSNLRTVATEFYASIEHKVKQRHRKYYSYPAANKTNTNIELAPIFLETRILIKQAMLMQLTHPHNVESSLKFLLLAYDNMIELIKGSFEYQDKVASLLPHDQILYRQFCNLVDILSFHIVRCYFAMEDPVAALRRHENHIVKVLGLKPAREVNWVSIQYELLAELAQLVPQSIRSSYTETKTMNKISSKYGRSTLFYGGIEFQEKNMDIMSHPGLLYMKAASSIAIGKDVQESTMSNGAKVTLLEKAVDSFEDNSSYKEYVRWLIAEEYLKSGDINSAITNYKLCKGLPESLRHGVLLRLFECYQRTNDTEGIISTAIKLTSMGKNISMSYISPLKEIKGLSVDTTVDHLLRVTPLLLNKTLKNIETYAFDECVSQIVLQPVIDMVNLNKLLGVELKLIVNEIKVRYSGSIFNDVTLKNPKEVLINSGPVQVIKLVDSTDGIATGEINIQFDKSDQIALQFSQIAKKVGLLSIESITIDSMLISENIKISCKEVIIFDETERSISHHQDFYNFVEGAKTLSESFHQSIRLNGSATHQLQILPVKPEVSVSVSNPQTSIIIGEMVQLPIKIDFKEKDGVDYNKLSILSNLKITGSGVSSLSTRTHWENLKDDAPLNLTNVANGEVKILNVSIQNPPSITNLVGQLNLMVELRLIEQEVEEGKEDEDREQLQIPLTSYDLTSFGFEVIKVPFECNYKISPTYRSGKDVDDMPNPFVLQNTTSVTMPVATRAWLGQVEIPSNDIEIVSAEMAVRSMNPEVQVKPVKSSCLSDKRLVSVLFTTASKSGFSHRNVIVCSRCTIKWKRSGSQSVHEYKTKEWDTTLPLSDPRVLLTIEQDDKKKNTRLRYVLENPTARIFSFTTQLVYESPWELIEELQLTPVVQPAFPVLPFTRHVLDYHFHNDTPDGTPMPSLRVYDVNYKVNLPTLTIEQST
ncbi:hypothetical protein CAAN1_14S02938 [[Candida] anglica]|uniref:Trafficking protein particle complex subunit 11 domain-containing protein n=1 Tax=[Candida] anglica TaxID=148631 RepID=A0ABP0ELF2_9ASCO